MEFGIGRTNKRKMPRLVLLLLCCLVLLKMDAPVFAENFISVWRVENGKVYYYDAQGNRVKGLQRIGDKTYCFSKRGEQLMGWQCIGGEYYYFNPKNKTGGYMLKNAEVNGCRLGKNGKAIVNSGNKRKLKIMVRCQRLAASLTNAKQTKAKKLKKLFMYVRNYPYINLGHFKMNGRWDLFYTEHMLHYGRGDCFCYAYLFGYLANAIGYRNITFVSSEGHGWIEMGGRVFDPMYSKVIGVQKCYNVPLSYSGVNGRINWRRYRFFVRNINS